MKVPAAASGSVETLSITLADPSEISRTLEWVRETATPAEGLTVAVRRTVPEKPWLSSMILKVPEDPADRLREWGFESMLKPFTVSTTLSEWDKLPDVAVTVTVYVPAGVEEEVASRSLELAEALTAKVSVVLLRTPVGPLPVTGLIVTVSCTVPEKPFRL